MASSCGGSRDESIRLLGEGAKVLREVSQLRTTDGRTVGGRRMLKLDAAKVGSMKELRSRFEPVFTAAASDTLIAMLGIRADGGHLWMPEGDAGDILVYDDAEIVESEEAEGETRLIVEIPLGDSGQTELRTLRLKHVGEEWRIDNNPYDPASAPADEGGADEGAETDAE